MFKCNSDGDCGPWKNELMPIKMELEMVPCRCLGHEGEMLGTVETFGIAVKGAISRMSSATC